MEKTSNDSIAPHYPDRQRLQWDDGGEELTAWVNVETTAVLMWDLCEIVYRWSVFKKGTKEKQVNLHMVLIWKISNVFPNNSEDVIYTCNKAVRFRKELREQGEEVAAWEQPWGARSRGAMVRPEQDGKPGGGCRPDQGLPSHNRQFQNITLATVGRIDGSLTKRQQRALLGGFGEIQSKMTHQIIC